MLVSRLQSYNRFLIMAKKRLTFYSHFEKWPHLIFNSLYKKKVICRKFVTSDR